MVEVATQQEGVIARRQLVECGMSNSRVGRWVACGRLHRIHPAVYAVGHRALSPRGRLIAALLYAGRGAALSHAAGAHWIGLIDRGPKRVEVCTPTWTSSIDGVKVHHRDACDRVFHRGLPVQPAPILLQQLAATSPFPALRKALARADFLGLLDPTAVRSRCEHGREGSAALRRALDRHLPELAKAANDFEADFLFLCERFGLPIPEVNARLGHFKPDMLWRDLRLIVELDGRDAHTRPAQVARDHDRDMTYRGWGYTPLRYTWAQVNFEPAAVAADLHAQMARLGAG